MSKTKTPAEHLGFEKVLDVLITEGAEAAAELFHQQLIATGRQINAELLALDEQAMEEELKDLGEDFLEEEVLELESEYFSKNEKEAKDVGVNENADKEMEDADDADADAEDAEMDADDAEVDAEDADMDSDDEDFEARFAALQAEFDALKREVDGESDPLDSDMDAGEDFDSAELTHDQAGIGDMSVVPDANNRMANGMEEGDDFSDIDFDDEMNLTESTEDYINKVKATGQDSDKTKEAGCDGKTIKVDDKSPVNQDGAFTDPKKISPKMPSDYSKADTMQDRKVKTIEPMINNTSKNKDFMKKVK